MGGVRMMRAVAAERSAGATLAAAAAGGLAESTILALPVHEAITGAVLGGLPLPVFALAFLASYTAAVVLVCRYRTMPRIDVAVATVAIAMGLLAGGGLTQRGVFTVLVCLLLGVRIASLAFRDWSVTAGAAFLIGALGFEALIGSSPTWDWGPSLLFLVPVFFVASLVGRAITVWTADDADELTDPARARSLRAAVISVAWMPVAMVAGVFLGAKGGALDRLSSFLAPIGNALASGLVWVFSQLSRPVFWLADRMGIDPEGVRRLFASAQANADQARDQAQRQGGHPSLLGRVIALLLFGLAIWGLMRLLRRLRPDISPAARSKPRPDLTVRTGALTASPEPTLRYTRRAPPADRVRRWYLETLTALEQRGLAKAPSLTPAEFLPEVIVAYPGSADAFRALTRAYEDVRYGRLTLDRPALRRLDGDHRSLLGTIRRQPPRRAAPQEQDAEGRRRPGPLP